MGRGILRLIYMRPEEIKNAVKSNIPILMAAGVIEYHGPHLPVGTDYLIANSICEEVEKSCQCVMAPPIYYGPTMNWAGGIEEGDIDFDPDVLYIYTKEVFRNLLNMGFKRIYVLQHHAGYEGLQSITIRHAAAALLREDTKKWSPGWGRTAMEEYPDKNIFGRIRVAAPDAFIEYPEGFKNKINFEHAGPGETEFIMAANPETVKLEALEGLKESISWLAEAHKGRCREREVLE